MKVTSYLTYLKPSKILFLQKEFDLVIILGDRWEIFGFGIAASFLKFQLPIFMAES